MILLLHLLILLAGISSARKPIWPFDFRWSSSGPYPGWNCLHIGHSISAKVNHWNDNYLCWKGFRSDPGLKWSTEGPVAGMKCTHVLLLLERYVLTNSYLCESGNTNYDFSWAPLRAIPGKSCIQWRDNGDIHTRNDNFLCADNQLPERDGMFPSDFVFSYRGIPVGYNCINAQKHRYFCWRQIVKDPGLRWSESGVLEGWSCREIGQTGLGFLCVSRDSHVRLERIIDLVEFKEGN